MHPAHSRLAAALVLTTVAASACAGPGGAQRGREPIEVPPPLPPLRLPEPVSVLDVRRVAMAPRVTALEPVITGAADEFGLPRSLMMGLVWVESRFDPSAVSRTGARGLTQLMPGTARDMARHLGVQAGRADPHEPRFAARAGAAYLAILLDRCSGAQTCALAAYYSGLGRVNKALVREGRLPAGGLRYARKVQAARRRFARVVAEADDDTRHSVE